MVDEDLLLPFGWKNGSGSHDGRRGNRGDPAIPLVELFDGKQFSDGVAVNLVAVADDVIEITEYSW